MMSTTCSNSLRCTLNAAPHCLQKWQTNAHVCAASAAMATGRKDIAFKELDAANDAVPTDVVGLVARATWMSATRGAVVRPHLPAVVALTALPVLHRPSTNARSSSIVASEPFATATTSCCCACRSVGTKTRQVYRGGERVR